MRVIRRAATIFLLLICGVGWFLGPANVVHLETRLSPPSPTHWAGTDHLGRDVLVRTLKATATATAVTLPAWAIATGLGVFLGVVGAVLGARPVGKAIDWAIRLIYSTPFFLALVGLGAVIGRGTGTVFLVIAVLGWAPAARHARAIAREALGAPYTAAAISMGFSTLELSRYVLVPRSLRPVLAASGGLIVEILALDLALTLYGFGPPPPSPTLGALLSEGLRFYSLAPWTVLVPLFTLCALCMCFRALLQDGRGVLTGTASR